MIRQNLIKLGKEKRRKIEVKRKDNYIKPSRKNSVNEKQRKKTKESKRAAHDDKKYGKKLSDHIMSKECKKKRQGKERK